LSGLVLWVLASFSVYFSFFPLLLLPYPPSICATVRKGCPCAEGNGHCESVLTTLSLVRKTSLHRLCSHNHHVLRGVGPACRVR
jgi:hypothetical protein